MGYEASTVKSICQEAGLTERYFYEHFEDRLDIFEAVYDGVMTAVFDATVEAVAAAPAQLEDRVRVGLGAFAGGLLDDPRRAQLHVVEVVGRSPELETRRREAMHHFARFLVSQWEVLAEAGALPGMPTTPPVLTAAGPETEVTLRQLAAYGLVGAANELVAELALGVPGVTRAEVIEVLVHMFLAVTGATRNET